jgi:hypothetical protein
MGMRTVTPESRQVRTRLAMAERQVAESSCTGLFSRMSISIAMMNVAEWDDKIVVLYGWICEVCASR